MPSEAEPTTKARPSGWHGVQPLDFGAKLKERPHPGKVRIELLTDPWSVWCWGFEPVRRSLELRYADVEFRPLLGGMFPEMPDHRQTGFDVERFFSIVQRTTGMPIDPGRVLTKDRPDSTYPACIHVHAMRLVAPQREAAYLRALREAVYLDGLNISKREVGARVAARVGVDPALWETELDTGRPQKEFQKALANLHGRQLHAYPTLLVTQGDRTYRIEGYQSLPAILGLVESVGGHKPRARPDPGLDDLFPETERMATREVAEVLGLSMERAFEALQGQEKAGKLVRERHATGDVWRRVETTGNHPIVRVW